MKHRELTKQQLKRRKKVMKGELDYAKFWNKHEEDVIECINELADLINTLHETNRCCGLDYVISLLVGRINIGGHGKVGALQTVIARVTQQAMPQAPQINVLDPAALAAFAKKRQEEAAKRSKTKKTAYVA